jgi:hypothetical protein
MEHRQALGGAVDPIEHEAMQMDVEIGGRAEMLDDQRSCVMDADPIRVNGLLTIPQRLLRLTHPHPVSPHCGLTLAGSPISAAPRQPGHD